LATPVKTGWIYPENSFIQYRRSPPIIIRRKYSGIGNEEGTIGRKKQKEQKGSKTKLQPKWAFA
jgi:hypothetical protein